MDNGHVYVVYADIIILDQYLAFLRDGDWQVGFVLQNFGSAEALYLHAFHYSGDGEGSHLSMAMRLGWW